MMSSTQVYFANVHPKFPDGGKMSQYLNSLSIGDTVDIRGPAGKVIYLGRGYFSVKYPGKPEEIRFATQVGGCVCTSVYPTKLACLSSS